jgi:hypothetical protein
MCDHALEAYITADGQPRTCDMRLCSLHLVRVGPGRDLCPFHARHDGQPRQGDLFARRRET